MKTTTLFILFLSKLSMTIAHSWVEQLQVIASNGTMIGATGYPRGNVVRDQQFEDAYLTNLIPPNGRSTGNTILDTDLMCKTTQTIGNQTEGSPALNASPGDMIALRYQENGHVTKSSVNPGKPDNRGTVFIYGTTQPSNADTLLSIHKVWNAAGTGGDGRGVLLATRNFDDGQCYQINTQPLSLARAAQFSHAAASPQGVNLWCQSDVTIPPTAPTSGLYTLYWVWDWPTQAGTSGFPNGLNETYTTCMDINMVAGPGTSKNLNFQKGQDLNSAAIESELSTAYIVTTSTSRKAAQSPTPATTTAPTASMSAIPASVNEIGFVTITVTQPASVSTVSVSVTVTVSTGQDRHTSSEAVSPAFSTPSTTGLSVGSIAHASATYAGFLPTSSLVLEHFTPSSLVPTMTTILPGTMAVPSSAGQSLSVSLVEPALSSIPTISSAAMSSVPGPPISPAATTIATLHQSTTTMTTISLVHESRLPGSTPYSNGTVPVQRLRRRLVRI